MTREYTFVIWVPEESPFTMTVQEDSETAARAAIQRMLDATYLSRDGRIGKLINQEPTP